MSEVKSLDAEGKVSLFWHKLFTEAKSGALFLYDDNSGDTFNNYFDAQWKKADLELIGEGTNVRWVPRYVERADALAEYQKKFDASPKLQGYLSYRILRKK